MQQTTYIRDIDAADVVGVSRTTFWRRIAPHLDKIKPTPNTTRFRLSDVLAYVEAHKQ